MINKKFFKFNYKGLNYKDMLKSANDVVRVNKYMYLFPSLFTILSLLLGFSSILLSINGQYIGAALAIFFAMVADGLDGRVARLTHTMTTIGAELDSMSDLISFGVAPAIMAYMCSLCKLGKMGALFSFIWVLATVFRLARFNVGHDKKYFSGFPCTAAAGLLAGFVLMFFNNTNVVKNGFIFVMTILTLYGSFLMVSRLQYFSFKDINLIKFKNIERVIYLNVMLIIMFFLFFCPTKIIFPLFMLYSLFGPIRTFLNKKQQRIQ